MQEVARPLLWTTEQVLRRRHLYFSIYIEHIDSLVLLADAMLRDHYGTATIICRSYDLSSQLHTPCQQLILREILLRALENGDERQIIYQLKGDGSDSFLRSLGNSFCQIKLEPSVYTNKITESKTK